MTRIKQILENYKWQIISAVGLNNRILNRVVYPVGVDTVSNLIAVENVDLTTTEYNEMLKMEELSRFKKLSFAHSKVLEYLGSIKILNVKNGDTIFDAAGGASAEYLKILKRYSGYKLNLICQDELSKNTPTNGVHYIKGSIDNVPLENESIDYITCHHSFEHFRQDLDLLFLSEAFRLLKKNGKLVIVPFFLTNIYTEIWNVKKQKQHDTGAKFIYDASASFCGWGRYEHFARTYDVKSIMTRIIPVIPKTFEIKIISISYDGNPTPDLFYNCHQPSLNHDLKVLLIKKVR